LIARGKALATHKGQTAIEWQVATLAIDISTLAGSSTLTFGTATGGFALSRGNTSPNAFSILF
jgi:hypothetical protein